MFKIAASGGFSRNIASASAKEVAHSTETPLGATDITSQVMSCEPSTTSNRAMISNGHLAILVPISQSGSPISPLTTTARLPIVKSLAF